jgi:predicted transcriptional regulator
MTDAAAFDRRRKPKAEPEMVEVPRGDDTIMLGVLSSIEAEPHVSQRSMSSRMGVALGLTNAYLKRCVTKGWVKIQAVPRRRYAYYLTPQGFAEKARLSGEYLTSSLQFFRRARADIADTLKRFDHEGRRRVVLAGRSDLAEIAVLSAEGQNVRLVAVLDDIALPGEMFHGVAMVSDVAALPAFDVVLITATERADKLSADLSQRLGAERVVTPRITRFVGGSA